MVIAAATKPARSVGSLVALPAPIVALVDKALAFEKTARWAAAATMRNALRQAHQTLFGRSPTREALEALFTDAVRTESVGKTRPLRTPVVTPDGQTMPAPTPPSAIGGTTAKPVSNSPAQSSVAGLPKAGAGRTIAMITGGAAVGALALGLAMRMGEKQVATTSLATTPVVSAAPSMPAAAIASSVAQPALLVAEPALSIRPATITPMRSRPTTTASASATTSPRAPVCDYVEYVDKNGITQVKQVCK
jgi:hypothetical protein